jgi:ubiquitin carboxyl-terminal hydrolase 9/24
LSSQTAVATTLCSPTSGGGGSVVSGGVEESHSTSSLGGGGEWLTSDRMAAWIAENDVLDIVLRDCMHQPQYVEKLEKILRFLIKERALTLKDLDKIWESQLGKHEAIEKNVHDLLAKLAWDFAPEQLDHLFVCFQKSWAANASRKQREKLLDLIRSLSEDDKEGVMANKVLDLLWNLAHSEDASTEIIDQAVAAHIKILDYSCSSDKGFLH